MDYITRTAIATRVLVSCYLAGLTGRDRERGQASAEYAGVMFVVVTLIAAVAGVAMTGIGDAVVAKITEAIGKIGAGAAGGAPAGP